MCKTCGCGMTAARDPFSEDDEVILPLEGGILHDVCEWVWVKVINPVEVICNKVWEFMS